MQHKTDNKTGRPFGWFGLLMIAVISGLVVKIVGDPIVDVLTPKIEEMAEEAEDIWDDQDWAERLREWLEQIRLPNEQQKF